MKRYMIILRNSTVITTHYVSASNAKRAKARLLGGYGPGWYVYKMQRV